MTWGQWLNERVHIKKIWNWGVSFFWQIDVGAVFALFFVWNRMSSHSEITHHFLNIGNTCVLNPFQLCIYMNVRHFIYCFRQTRCLLKFYSMDLLLFLTASDFLLLPNQHTAWQCWSVSLLGCPGRPTWQSNSWPSTHLETVGIFLFFKIF